MTAEAAIHCAAVPCPLSRRIRASGSGLAAKLATGRYVPSAYLQAARSISRCTTPRAVAVKPKPTTAAQG